MKRLLVAISFFILIQNLCAQGKKFQNEAMEKSSSWFPGAVQFADGREQEGLVQYNDINGVLSFRSGEASESFGPKTVNSFYFTDSATQRKRNFVSIPYPQPHKDSPLTYRLWKTEFETDKANQVLVNTFVEILCEAKTFALLAKTSPIRMDSKKNRAGATVNGTGAMVVFKTNVFTQNEILFFLTQDGDLKPYVETVTKDYSLWGNSSSKKKSVDRDLIEDLTGEYYPKLMEYAKANELRRNKKEDIVKLIEFYNELTGKKD